jgi:hypothetical protein
MAPGGIVDETILQAVDGITGVEHGLVDHRELAHPDDARLILEHGLRHGNAPRIEGGLRVRGGAGNDAVVVVWKTLRLGQRLASASRAAVPVRTRRSAAVELVDDRLGLHRHLVL